MSESADYNEEAIPGAAYFIWERQRRPELRAQDHWLRAISKRGGVQPGRDNEPMEDEERILAGHPDVNMPALLTRDVLGG
ncbi:MAG TPA: DUF2934 domain-containing protein [Acetobacteraceae bacterium]|nr:DUF2934 domain-containing protein [Acetobacteraceae bacterium]